MFLVCDALRSCGGNVTIWTLSSKLVGERVEEKKCSGNAIYLGGTVVRLPDM